MKTILKSFIGFFAVLLLMAATAGFVYAQPGPVTAPAGTSMIPSDYVDSSIPDDPVFIFCSPDANGDSLLGTLSVSGGLANSEYVWGLYDPDPLSPDYQTFVAFDWQNGASSTVDSLQSGFYQVIITNNPGAPNEATYCRRAHVFVNKTILGFDPIDAGCQPFTLTGGFIDALNDFTIYDPPPTPFVVDSTTEITVCFWADHTFVSDLGFYLIGPGGNRIDLLPPVSAWDQGIQVTDLDISVVTDCDPNDYYTNCNSGNHIDNFCFTSALPAGDPTETACICDMSTPLTGTFASCDVWDDIYGNMASQGGWKVQIYDCTPADVGSLQRVTINFTGQSECGTTTYEYDSGPINVTINDGACDPQTAATYEVPLKETSQHTITNEVTAEWSSYPAAWNTAAWGSQDFASNPAPNIDPEPTSSTHFFLTVYDHLYDTLGNEITSANFPYYVPCEPVVSQYFETLPTDATILSYPAYICATDPPVQLVPLEWGGAWSSITCGTYPNGCITGGGFFFPNLALLGDNLIKYEFGGVCADEETVIINVVDAPVVSNIEETCNTTNTQFQVSFTVTGGNPGAYSFLNAADSSLAAGSILGSTWTSGWINSMSNYSFIVTDNNDCDPSIISGYHNCGCESDAGNMSPTMLELCAFDQAVVQVLTDGMGNPTYTLDGNDGHEYFLHDNQFSTLGNVMQHNTSGIFLFQPPMVYGQTYYISHVVGNNIGTPTDHVVDITDGCLSVSQGTPVVWYEFPTSNAGLDDFICGNTIQLDADTPAIGVGTWSCLTATGTIYNPNFNDPKVSVVAPYFDTNQYGCLLNTDFTYRWTVKNGPCEIFDDITVTLKPIPEAFAGNDYSICGMDAELQGQFSSLCGPTGSSEGEWFGPGDISQPLMPVTDVTVFSPGNYTWIWREFNDECWDEDFVTITFIEQPLVDANHNDSVCGLVYNLQAISTMGTGWWEGPPNTIFGNSSSPHTTAQIAFSGLSEVTAVFTWNEQNAFCFAEDEVTIVYSAIPNAAAGLDDWICGTSYTFDADILGYEYAMGTWKTPFITADFNDNHDPTATVTIPNTGSFPGQPQAGSFGDSSHVTIPFTWIMDNNRCTDEDEVLITFYQIPESFAGPDTSVCGKVYDMRAVYSIGSSKGKWTMVQGPGGSTIPPTWSDDTHPDATVQVPLHGEYIFQWKEDNLHNQTCSTVDQVVVFFIEIPDVDAGPDKYVCGEDTELEAIASTGNGQWLPTQATISDFFDPHSPTHYGLTGTNDTVTYVWQEYNEHNGIQCVSNSEVNIVFMIIPESEVFFDPGISTDHVCGKLETVADNILVGVDPGITGPNVLAYWYGPDANFFPNSFAKDPDSVRVGSYGVHEFNWVVENHHGDSVCADTSITIFVDFIEQPIANVGFLYETDTACLDRFDSLYQFHAEWSTSTGDSIAGKWITTSPDHVHFWYINPIELDTLVSDSLPNCYVSVEDIDPIDPEIYDLVWQEENYGFGVYGNLPDFCLDWDTTTVTFAPRPTGRIEITDPVNPTIIHDSYHPHCIGKPAKFKAQDDYSIVSWDWSDIDDGIVIDPLGVPYDSIGPGPIFVQWPDAIAGEEHYIRLITKNEWGCISRATADTIFEPDMINVEIETEPAKCGEPDGEILLETPPEYGQPHIFNWIDTLGIIHSNSSASSQDQLATGDYYFTANALSQVVPNTEIIRCTDKFLVHVHDTGYIAALYQIPLTDTIDGIAPETIDFTNVSYMVDGTYVTPEMIYFSELIQLIPPFEELDAEYEWRFYKLPFDTALDVEAPLVIPTGLDPIEINNEFFVEETSPSVTFDDAGYYIVELLARSDFGCTDTLRNGYIFVDAKSDIVPGVNVFTPNGDGVNDFLEFETATLRSMHGKIFNRWGKLIFEWTWNENDQEPNPGWWDGKLDNGQDATPGVYFYVIEGIGLDGNEFTGEDYAKAFHLIRDKQ